QDMTHDREAWEDYMRDSGKGKAHIKKRKMAVKEARRILVREESKKLLDFEDVIREAIQRAEENGVVFVDEIDKLVGPRVEIGRDISGEGVQRDLLPLVEGTTVMTRYGPVKTSHILFIAAGTFYSGKPSDLIPEIQGRFPLRVEMQSLQEGDLARILTEPENSLTKQYKALLATEEVELDITEDGVNEIARIASLMNQQRENIGARRLFTIMEKVLEDLSFNAPSLKGQKVTIDSSYVQAHVAEIVKNEDLARYIM
ncbi:MAG: AAA family ATPase, partial [Candidatus Tectomicrobia bacterium]|nr:AAA family ATPase [Candidatus Tectomicrobia bacterium]